MGLTALYGSRARGDHDASSDRDLLQVDFDEWRTSSHKQAPTDSIVRYSWNELYGMREYGSLFLRHLALESTVVSGTSSDRARYWALLQDIPTYSRASQDAKAFDLGALDSIESIQDGLADAQFELAHLATIARHSAILGCYLIDQETYTRLGAVRRFCKFSGLPAFVEAFSYYYQYRLAIARNLESPGPASESDVLSFANDVRQLVREVERARKRKDMQEKN